MMPQVVVPIILMSILSVLIMEGVGGLLIKHFGQSPYTLPFNLCMWIWLSTASGLDSYFPVNEALSPHGLLINQKTFR